MSCSVLGHVATTRWLTSFNIAMAHFCLAMDETDWCYTEIHTDTTGNDKSNAGRFDLEVFVNCVQDVKS